MKRNDQEGAVVIEATLSLSAFMFLVVIILSIVNICLAQAKIASLVHGIAKDVSNYSYIYTMTGVDEWEAGASQSASQARGSIDVVLSDTTSTYDKISEIANAAFDQEFWDSFMNLAKVEVTNEVKAVVLDKICRNVAEQRLTLEGKSADEYLKWLGIESGVKGIDFMDSEFCPGGTDDIKIVADYDVHVLKLLGVDFSFHFKQCAYTKAWKAADSSNQEDDNQDE